MVRRPALIIAICVGAAAVLGIWVFVVSPSSEERARATEFFETPQKYDMKNGQEMRPRW
ncbi:MULTISPECIES: entry exclusion protein TrbK [Hyphomicrobiales]|jgi:Ti type entry exclusion protein TrbK|uniref:entry exclusion protein TrbK n=1 Tax=Hyphomicrobiales TaxID=356 RepID=UPI0007C68446|nr:MULTISPECIES: entry exclusion protein TrbK [Hyphomicrobiales]OJY70759.1 MAG: entry exclusion protein TrbK [Rhizobium sp. 60-20]